MKPYKIIPLSEFIKEELEERRWSKDIFAKKIDASMVFVELLLNNKAVLTYELIKKLSEVFDQPFKYWRNLYLQHLKWEMAQEEEKYHEDIR